MHRSIKPETGNRYGLLTVVSTNPVGTTVYGVEWRCICDCGNRKTVRGVHLRAGVVKSCGCLMRGRPHEAIAALAKNRVHRAQHLKIVEGIDDDSDAMIAEEMGL